MEYRAMYSQDRSLLKNEIPLNSPYVMHLELTSHCNIQCEYCIHALDREEIIQRKYVFGTMGEDILERIYSGLREFEVPVKKIVLGGVGEPTLHKNLSDITANIKTSSPSTKVGIITNGLLLSPKLSNELINAGLDEVKISLQGLNSEDYLARCGAKIDFDEFMSNLKYLYDSKGKYMKIFVKIPSNYLTHESEQKFFSLFNGHCDYASIEKLGNIFDFDEERARDLSLNTHDRFGMGKISIPNVCAIIFFRINVFCDGAISLCNGKRNGAFTLPKEMFLNSSLNEIWESDARKSFLLTVLKGASGDIPALCRDCFCRTTFSFDSDYIDDCADEILERIQ